MIRVVTDTSSDLPDDLVARHSITLVPLTIRFGDEEFVDRVGLDPAGFWAKLRESESLPETAAPSAGAFRDAYAGLRDEGATGVVAVCISSQLSATLQSAQVAASEMAPDFPIRVVDSGLTSAALGLVAVAAARSAAGGADLATVQATAAAAAAKTNVLGALDTLEFLRRGGRIGSAQAFFGSLLSVKPLISLEDGVVAPAGRVRTRRKAIAALVDKAQEIADSVEEVVLVHGSADDIDAFRAAVAEHIPADLTSVAELGSVVGTHAGPGLIGICYRLK